METINLLTQISNPLEQEDVLKTLVEVYSKQESPSADYYYYLNSIVEKKYKKGEHYLKDGDELYSTLFNIWKNSIVNLPSERIVELKSVSEIGPEISKLKAFLSTIKDVKTKKEADAILNGEYEDSELANAIKKYKWNKTRKGSSYIQVCSKYLTANQDKFPDIEHRLYITCESKVIYKIANEFVKKCTKYGIPYYFKFTPICNRDENIIIYSDSSNLYSYIQILEEIKEELGNDVIYVKEAPLLTGKIKNWLGYGTEPQIIKGSNNSYLGLRSEIISSSIKKIIYQYIVDNVQTSIEHNGKIILYKDFLTHYLTEYFCEKLKSCISQNIGVTETDIENEVFRKNIYNTLNKKLINNINRLYDNEKEKIKDIRMRVRDNKEVVFRADDLELAIMQFAETIFENDKTLYEKLRQLIIDMSVKNGISVENFSVDNSAIASIKEIKKQSLEEKVINENTTDSDKAKDVIISQIDPEILNQFITMPNGQQITVLTYLKSIVFPLIPTSGKFILKKDDVEIEAKEFIERYILGECQTLGNNLPPYLHEKTKNNHGIINVFYEGKEIEINPIDVVEFIEPELLTKRIATPNGKSITAEEFITLYFSDYIPTSGRLIMTDNSEIGVIDYIEEILIPNAMSERYKGNLCEILYNTTKQNRGIVKKLTDEPKDTWHM